MTDYIAYLPPFGIALGLALVLTPLVRSLSLKRGFVAKPSQTRWHRRSTALFGGVAIYAAFMATVLFFEPSLNEPATLGLLFGGAIVFVVGVVDDLRGLRPVTKLLAQIAAACVVLYSGTYFTKIPSLALAMPLTIVWIIGVTNAFNLIDNMDGLCAGTTFIASGILFVYSVINHLPFVSIISAAMAGASLGFLRYNFYPAKIFMGDCGSMFLGFTISVVAVIGTANHMSNLLATLIVPVLVLGVPIFDTTFVSLLRRIRGRPISEGGRDHTSHRLVVLGLSERKTVLLIYAMSLGFGLIALFYARVDVTIITIFAALAIIFAILLGLFLGEVTVDSEEELERARYREAAAQKVILNSMLYFKRQFAEMFMDFLLICLSFYSANLLRFGGILSQPERERLWQALPILIVVKLSSFYYFGLYRGMWRYVGLQDLFSVAKAVTVGSVASVFLILYFLGFQGYSRAAFFIDWLLLLVCIAGVRVALRAFKESLLRLERDGGKRVLILGAGDAGEMLLREINNNRNLRYVPVGFLDDNPVKRGRKIHGIEVLGTSRDLPRIVGEKGVEELFIAIPSASEEQMAGVTKLCEELGIPYRKMAGII
ncbi:MAG: hypothetical protein ACE5LX_00530 [Nitrospinota bacterium]